MRTFKNLKKILKAWKKKIKKKKTIGNPVVILVKIIMYFYFNQVLN